METDYVLLARYGIAGIILLALVLKGQTSTEVILAALAGLIIPVTHLLQKVKPNE